MGYKFLSELLKTSTVFRHRSVVRRQRRSVPPNSFDLLLSTRIFPGSLVGPLIDGYIGLASGRPKGSSRQRSFYGLYH